MGFDVVWRDVAVAWRSAVRRPGFSLLVVATLAVGLGVNAAIFALIDTILLRPLPYPQPDRIAFLWQTLPQHNVFDVEATPADYAAWHSLKSFASLAMVATDTHTITGDTEPERVRGARVTASTLPLLGIAPSFGRPFSPDEDDAGANAAAILSDGLWRRRYGADRNMIGRTIQIDGTPHTIIGVMPPDALLPGALAANSDLWLAMRMSPEERTNEISHNYTVIGRLAEGVTAAQATGELSTYPTARALRGSAGSGSMGARAEPIAEATVTQIRPALVALLAGVGLLLLAAAANVTTLLLSRAVTRGHDLAIRTALGASRGRLLRHTTAETLLLTSIGAALGLSIGAALLRVFVPLFRESLPVMAAPPHIDVRVAATTFLIAIVLGAIFGMVAARPGREASLSEPLRTGRRTAATPAAARAGSALVVVQVAFAVVLLAAAGLMLRSVARLAHVNPGFASDHLLTFRLALESSAYESPARRASFVDELTRRLAATPGVVSAAVTSRIPLGGARGASLVDVEGRTPAPGELVIIDQRHVTPEYFQAMRIPLLSGRTFTESDDARGEPVAIVNKTMAERYWPGSDPINHRVRLAGGFDSGEWFRIVGVIADVRHVALSRPPVPEMYRPYAQASAPEFSVVVKTAGSPAAASGACRTAVQSLDRNLAVYDLRTMDDRMAASFARTRATTMLLALTAVLAAVLAGIAIYGSIWYSVAQRIPEIGIRLALGAAPRAIVVRIVGKAIALTAVGLLAGFALAVSASSLIAGLLFETRLADPTTFALVFASAIGVTLLAAAGPARRAIAVDPMTALRCE